jgi:hypothetical protein
VKIASANAEIRVHKQGRPAQYRKLHRRQRASAIRIVGQRTGGLVVQNAVIRILRRAAGMEEGIRARAAAETQLAEDRRRELNLVRAADEIGNGVDVAQRVERGGEGEGVGAGAAGQRVVAGGAIEPKSLPAPPFRMLLPPLPVSALSRLLPLPLRVFGAEQNQVFQVVAQRPVQRKNVPCRFPSGRCWFPGSRH